MLVTMRWTVVIPAKATPAAKSRLAGMTPDAASHQLLVEAIRADTIAAVRDCASVARVLVVTDAVPAATSRFEGAQIFVQVAPGLNAAVREAAEHAARRWPEDGVAALVGDLPALGSPELDAALANAAASPAAFVPDADGTGTTMLTAMPGATLRPQFGTDSAARHARDATTLWAGPGLRRDVDTAENLVTAATELGVGPATFDVLRDLGITLSSSGVGMMDR